MYIFELAWGGMPWLQGFMDCWVDLRRTLSPAPPPPFPIGQEGMIGWGGGLGNLFIDRILGGKGNMSRAHFNAFCVCVYIDLFFFVFKKTESIYKQ